MADKSWSPRSTFSLLILAVCIIACCEGKVQIHSMRVPGVIQEGDMESVVLDCDYTLKDSYGLVVKWYHMGMNENGAAKRVYQWIMGQRPLAVGAFKNAVNLAYKASSEPHSQHRAMNILHPSRNMSGTYTCSVETYNDGSAQDSAKMLVFVPQATLQLSQERLDEDSVRVSCVADDVFPAPEMSIRLGNKVLPSSVTETNVTQSSDLLYDIRSVADIEDADLPEDPTEVSCELAIPQANYTVRQEALMYKDSNSATSLMPYLHLLTVAYFLSSYLML